MAENAKWYVVHTYSGYENAVKTAIEKFVANRHLEDMILRIEIPMETVTEVTDKGVKKEVERKLFPGYVLTKMVLTDDTWHLIRNIRGVTGFVGTEDSGAQQAAAKVIPLTEAEVVAMGVEEAKAEEDFAIVEPHEIVVMYNVGDSVRITDGPFVNQTGIVEEIEPDKNKVRVIVSMFGRETPVELELEQVEVLS